jgi:FtsP/CotA-like multicopper oxidase with cupredoxin domain
MLAMRSFFRTAAVFAVFLLFTAGSALASQQIPQTPLPGKKIPKYVEPVPVFGPASGGAAPRVDGMKTLTVSMEEFQEQILPGSIYTALPAPYNLGTYVWGYKISDGTNTYGPFYPAFTIEAKRGTPTNVTYINDLINPVLQKYITVDQTIHWADPLGLMCEDAVPPIDCTVNPADPCCQPFAGPVPAVAHLHGGEDPSAFDGGPDSWFTPDGTGPGGIGFFKGPGFVKNAYTYPNGQEATTLFFHDHALGATRLNLYAGLVGFYFIRDDGDTGLDTNSLGLPAGPYEVELAIQDKQFDTNGQLIFPDGSPCGLNGCPPNPSVHPYWNPEFFGDVIVVNGKSWPYLNVEPRRYRFRIVDGANARFFDLRLMNTRKMKRQGPAIWQIGTDGGLLDAPVMVAKRTGLFIAPGERADIIVDFSGYKGQTLTLVNKAKAPFPSGDPPDPRTTGQVMEFRVNLPLSGTDTSFDPAASGATLRGGPNQQAAIVRLADGAGALASGVVPDKVRQLTLNEVEGPEGPLEVILNNTDWGAALTENPRVGATELWEIVNLTEDAHPIHVHLVQFQLVNRQRFNKTKYEKVYEAAFPGGEEIPESGPPMTYDVLNADGAIGGNPAISPYLKGPIMPPAPNEAGWKDTFKMNPGEVTRVVIRWAQQDVPVTGVSAGVNTYPFDPTAGMGITDSFGFPGGPGYVWHCHIVDHEDNEMMRPYRVQP